MFEKKISEIENPLDFIKEINSFNKHGDIVNLFTKGYCYGFALMVKQVFKEGIIYWDKYINHAIIKINNIYYDINGVYEPRNYSMLFEVDVTILEGSSKYKE